jgi:RNA polymerase sigma-70 factor, ECF subfamily
VGSGAGGPGQPDAARLALVRSGDRDALNQLLVDHYDRIYAICRRMTNTDADALDATQDALLAIVAGLPRFDGRSRFTTWAYRVTTNACLDHLRRERRRTSNLVLDDDAPAPRDGSPELGQRVADRLVLDQALERLPPAFRAAVVLRDVIGLDYAEIARVLDLAPGTVRSRIARGRRALALELREVDPAVPGNPAGGDDVEGGNP